MINKKPTAAFQFILGCALLLSVAAISCNDTETKESTTDTTKVEKMMEEPAVTPPPIKDSTTMNDDSLTKRPIVPGNKVPTP